MSFFVQPSAVLYDDLSRFGGIRNVDAAQILLSSRVIAGGRSPRERVTQDRSYLTRRIVQAEPGTLSRSAFADFETSSATIYHRILSKQGRNRAAVVAHYSQEAAADMAQALDNYRLGSGTYLNEVKRLLAAGPELEKDRPLLLVMLFCCTGCLCDPDAAVRSVEDFARRNLARGIVTPTNRPATGGGAGPHGGQVPALTLSLIRTIDGINRPPFYPLDPNGTVIGAIPSGTSVITDVGADVSRRHLRVWRQDGRWLCQGLDSTNGTRLHLVSTGTAVWVEPPRAARQRGASYPPQELHEGDQLQLGASTFFRAQRVALDRA